MIKCFQFERGQNFPFDWPASVSNILSVRGWAEAKIVGRNFTSRIRPLKAVGPFYLVTMPVEVKYPTQR